jgi:hypothetical protein
MTQPEPHWLVKYRRGAQWFYVMTQPVQAPLQAPRPREFGVKYRAGLAGAAELLEGADAVELERVPPLHDHTPAAT